MANFESGPGKGQSRASHLLSRRRLIAMACLLALVGVGLYLLTHPGRSLEERLRVIDAAYAIPDEENAAGAYIKLARECLRSPWVFSPMPPTNPSPAAPRPPWRSDDELQAAKWLEDCQSVIDSLMDIGRKPNCRFSVVDVRGEAGQPSFAARQWSLLLLRAANDDLGAGRTAGLEKLLGVLRLAQHFRTQINPLDSSAGRFILVSGLQRVDRLIMTEQVPTEWLTQLEAALPPAERGWTGNDTQMEAVKWLYEQQREHPSTIKRLTGVLARVSESRLNRRIDLMEVGRCRASRVLLTLRRYRNETGVWPKGLREIESRVSPEVLIDPLTGRPFVYRLTDRGVLLYSVGWNHIDQGGSSDDDCFWPLSQRWAGTVKY
jgi:hypothetical protein